MLPAHLSGNVARGIIEGEPIAQFELGTMRNFVYLVIDWKSRVAAIVDPRPELAPIDLALEKHGLKLERILLTHTHHDHVGGLTPLLERDPRLPVHLHPEDHHRLKKWPEAKTLWVQDGEMISVGTLALKVIHTPGHSAGEVSYYLSQPGPYLFTGDTLFIRDCGRTDFPDSDVRQMFASLQRIKSLPDATIILCGHHYQREVASWLGQEKKLSPPLLCRSVQELEVLP